MQDGRGGIDFKCLCTSENIRRKRLYSKEDGCFQSNSNLVRKVITLSNKVYVDVLAEFSKDGLLIPKEITWEDGRKYEITRVKDKRRAASTRAGGVGERAILLLQSFVRNSIPISLMPMQESRNRRKRRHRSRTGHRKCLSFL